MFFKKKEVVHSKYYNQPECDSVVRIGDIKIPPSFDCTKPLDYKMKRCRSLYKKLGHLDKAITVIVETNEKGKPSKLILVDGYSRYLYAKEQLKLQYVPVKYITIEEWLDSRGGD